MPKVATRGRIPPFIAMEMLRAANERAAAGQDVLHLELGQPAASAPARVIEAARSALGRERLGYTEALGLPILRERIARHYRDMYGIDVPARRIVVTTGSSGAFLLGFLAAFDAGDRIALASPAYPAYRNILLALDLVPVDIPSGPETRFQPTPALLEAAGGNLAGLIVASPSNPAGTMVDRPHFEALTSYCRQHDVRLVSDEIYHGITYGMEAVTAAALDGDAIVVNSFSKYFAMTGWRLGWMIAPEDLLRSIESLAQSLFISPPTLPQHAGVAALDCRVELDDLVSGYAENRALLMRNLPAAGFERFAPVDGAFYLYADVGNLTNDSAAFCQRMLDETGVAATPGIDFDPARGHRYLRFSFAGAGPDIACAIERLTAWRR
ncbi:MAG: aminotransferase class I/II-fold pyridoxal phosphate-dependent enzyme [Dongiaceae bacterium]